ncbi:MAG: hypothetical protein DRP78_03210 [Candidatus Omnitrophota bacterium]|nr:MAG: hypothetical protein DRP78_03210 [Candidatus Omnitrophota bacterium]
MLKRIFIAVVLIIIILLAGLITAKNIIVKTAVVSGVKAVTGLNLEVENIDIGLMKTLVAINGLKLFNPEGIEDKVMVNIPEIYVDYNLKAFLQKKIHLQVVRLNLEELLVVKAKNGTLNLDALKPMQTDKKVKKEDKKLKQPQKKGKMPEIKIDLLDLKIGKVIYKDYSQEPLQVKEYKLNINEHYENITNIEEFVKTIVVKTLMKTSIDKFVNLGIAETAKDLKDKLKQDVLENVSKDAVKNIEDTFKNTAKETKDKLKELLPF